jgi:hypothetical protein
MPFGELVTDSLATALTWIKDWVLPLKDGEVVWPLVIALLLTSAWMFCSNKKTKLFLNTVGGWAAAAMFFAIMVRILIWIPKFVWNYLDIHSIFKVVLLGAILFFMSGVVWAAVKKWLDAFKTVFGWARLIPRHAKANPNKGFMILGGLFLAGLICGEKATMLTEKWGLVPGIIPGISAAVGLFFLLRQIKRDLLGQKALQPPKDGGWLCEEEKLVPKLDSEGKRIPIPEKPGKFKAKKVRCKELNPSEAVKCRACGAPRKALDKADDKKPEDKKAPSKPPEKSDPEPRTPRKRPRPVIDEPAEPPDKKRVKRKDLGPKMQPNTFRHDCGRKIN